jgi:uncharacterized Zn finger protein (UPF0148 family)
MSIFPYLTNHTCPECGVRLARDPCRSDRVVCPICWAVAWHDADRGTVSELVNDRLTPQEIEDLRRRFELPA